jgi:lipid II:glycine glycyltransferase (peptidoglycan interpeptide bridge formation enzyme)
VAHPAGHLLQLSRWGALKARFGWQAVRLAVEQDGQLRAGAQVLFRRLPLGRTLAYVPKGPLMDFTDDTAATQLWAALHELARSRRAILLKVEPELPDDTAVAARLRNWGFRSSPQTVQPRHTMWVDLTPDEEAILAGMKSKTRYNVRLAARKGVRVCEGTLDDFDAFYAGDELLGALMAFACGSKAWYFYGASSNRHRNRMPSYLLQWEAMRWAKAQGCTAYDLWGIPDEDEATLEAQFTERRDGLWGVYRFKRGFGGRVHRYLGAYDYIYSPLWYKLYAAFITRRGSTT